MQKGKKQSKSAFQDHYGVPKTAKLRYVGLKGIYWYWLARFVRKRDALLFGKCITCGRAKTFDELQAGHFAPAGDCGFDLLFDLRNVNGECGQCNGFDEAHLWGYERGLDARYGNGTSALLRERYEARHRTSSRGWSVLEYERNIAEIRAAYDTL